MKQLSLLGGGSPAATTDDDAVGLAAAAQSPAMRALGARLPAAIHLGTSSWSFPGWAGLVYDRAAKVATLARAGLGAYSAHPLFRTVSIDRGFYAPIPEAELALYRDSAPLPFKFLVKAPSAVTDAAKRDAKGSPFDVSDSFLDVALAVDTFVGPVTRVLGASAGPLVFQISPLASFASPERVIDALQRFLSDLPKGPLYALEVRDPELIGRRLLDALTSTGARYVVSVHARMPPASVQVRFQNALPPGPLVARWNLVAGQTYESAKASFAPFDRLVVEDFDTRAALASAAIDAVRTHQPAFVVANNKAEGSAPLTIEKLARAIVSGAELEHGREA